MALRKFTGISHIAFGNKSYVVPEDGIVEIEPEVAGSREFVSFCETVNFGDGTSCEVIEGTDNPPTDPEAAPVEPEAPKAKSKKAKADTDPEAAPVEA